MSKKTPVIYPKQPISPSPSPANVQKHTVTVRVTEHPSESRYPERHNRDFSNAMMKVYAASASLSAQSADAAGFPQLSAEQFIELRQSLAPIKKDDIIGFKFSKYRVIDKPTKETLDLREVSFRSFKPDSVDSLKISSESTVPSPYELWSVNKAGYLEILYRDKKPFAQPETKEVTLTIQDNRSQKEIDKAKKAADKKKAKMSSV